MADRKYRHWVAAQAVTRTIGVDGHIEAWQTFASLRADVDPATPSAVQRQVSTTLTAPVTQLVKTPYRRDLSIAHRLLFKGRLLYIIAIQNAGERNEDLMLACEERAT
jgi:head-tail adaptor